MARLKKLALLAVAGSSLVAVGALLLRHRVSGGLVSLAEPAQTARVAKPFDIADAAEVIYDGKLSPGWSDWGWGPHTLPAQGPAQIGFSGFGGIILQHTMLQPSFSGLSFRYKAPEGWPDFLQVALKFSGGQGDGLRQVQVEKRHVAVLPDGFREVFVPWNELDPDNSPFDRVLISAAVQVGSEPVLLDKILLLRSDGAKAASSTAPQRAVELEVLCAAAPHPISELIYGFADGEWQSGASTWRIGGNPTSRYNWDLSAWNSAHDWFFENQKAPVLFELLDEGVSQNARAALTVPMIGWVAKDTTSFGFPVSLGKPEKVDPNRPRAGNGQDERGKPIKPGEPTETSVPAPPELIQRWVAGIRERDRQRGKRSVESYILDNEPTLWHVTHRDVHPTPLDYDELLDRTIRYASAIRAADPEVPIAGPAEWGWLGYQYSGKDQVQGKFLRSDRRAHGDEALIPWYLKRLAEYEKQHGKRLLDILDVHFYPAADGMYGTNARTDADAAQLRLRSTRSLWDSSYVDESWIAESIQLIPRLKGWIAANYPGTRISIGEWSFGADAHISGALATAEALGRFGQQGIHSAYYWSGPKKDTGTFWAFRAFRNFDGKGGRFLDVSVPTRESETVSVFASRDASSKHLVAILINRDPLFRAKARIALGSCGQLRNQRMFGYVSGSTSLSEGVLEAPQTNGLSLQLPPFSITVLDLGFE